MRAHVALPFALVLLVGATNARASEPTTTECLSATETSITLRTEHKLRAARVPLLVCSAGSCPTDIRTECVHRIEDLNAATPTVVFAITTATGQELTDVKVTMDGEVIADHLDGAAVAVDPGSHVFTFEGALRPVRRETFVIHQGEKNRRESVTLEAPTVATGASKRTSSTGQAQRVAGIVTGSVGVLSAVVGGIFGAMTFSTWSRANSECPGHAACSAQATGNRADAVTYGTASTIGFVAAGALAAGGITLYLTAPKDRPAAVGMRLAPGAVGIVGSF